MSKISYPNSKFAVLINCSLKYFKCVFIFSKLINLTVEDFFLLPCKSFAPKFSGSKQSKLLSIILLISLILFSFYNLFQIE